MFETPKKSARADRIRRIFDIAAAVVALIAFSPLILFISGAILIESGRPVLFSQVRLGLNGRHFRILKFRKFGVNAGSAGLPLTLTNDPRMTAVGRILARTKLDELPQLVNVLRGEMAMVGPRPESLDFADCFCEANRCVLEFRPGIFGPSQSAFRDECSLYPVNSDPTSFYRRVLFPIKMSVDLAYYPNRSLLSDLKWIFASVLAVTRIEGISVRLPAPPTITASAMTRMTPQTIRTDAERLHRSNMVDL